MPRLAPFSTRYAPSGMVCSVDQLASEAGVGMLRAGGSAVDAAIATSAVLAVTTQHMCGMGGDLFALVHSPDDRQPAVLNASGRSGSGADAARLRAEGHQAMPFRGDIRSVPVPGCVDGWIALHDRYGTLPLVDVLEPARHYAADGFPASDTLSASVTGITGVKGADDYLEHETVAPGTVIRRPGVARALAAIGREGRDGFYGGEFGEGLLAIGNGEYHGKDLEEPNADWVEPLVVDVWNRRLWTVPPNSQGYLTLASARIAGGLDLPDDPDDPLWAHLLIESARQAGYDRLDVLHENADGAALVAEERLAPRRAAIDIARAAALGDRYSAGGTIYLCAVDSSRMGISLIQSNAAGFGSLIVEPNTRIFLQNRGIGFSLEPGHPAEYGPRRRPPHTLSPALVTRLDGPLDMVIGTMGGDSQPQVLLQLLTRLLVHDERVGDAIAAPRWALGPTGDGTGFETWGQRGQVEVQLESRVPDGWREGLLARGHHVASGRNFGHAHVIRVGAGHLAGAADPRALSGSASGY